jgi:hypothetical protein
MDGSRPTMCCGRPLQKRRCGSHHPSPPVTGPVAEALIAAESTGAGCDLADLGSVVDVGTELVRLADTPLAPIAAAALVTAITSDPDAWTAVTTQFAAHLGLQTSYLALLDTLDALLDSPIAAQVAADPLHSAVLEAHRASLEDRPLLAVAHLEGALRLAVAGAVTPYLVLHSLTNTRATLSEDYLERLPRLIGIALDAWDTDTTLTAPLTVALRHLHDLDASRAEAAYELACARMRAALRETDPAAAGGGLLEAAGQFTEANALDDTRDDAAAYAAVCSAIGAFGAADATQLTDAVEHLETVMARRTAWTRNMNQPAWRRPKLEAEVEWLGIVLDLRRAAARLTEPSWLEATAAVGQLARAYTAERSTTPAAGLTAIVRPAIENPVAANAVLVDQLTRTVEADRQREEPTLPPAAELLLNAVRERRSPGGARNRDHSEGTDAEGDEVLDARIDRFVPQLRDLGDDIARVVVGRLDDGQLVELGGVLAVMFASGVAEHPALGPLRASIVEELSTHPEFFGETRAAVLALLDRTLTFLQDRYERGGPFLPGRPHILRPLAKGDPRPKEQDLQWEFYFWLANSDTFAGRVQCEAAHTATGRVDVIVRIKERKLVTEVKRELADSTPESLDQYVPQSAEYSGGNVSFSQLLVLDLTDHSNGAPPLRDLAWVREHRSGPVASPQHVVVAVVVGNRLTPRQLTDARTPAAIRRAARQGGTPGPAAAAPADVAAGAEAPAQEG